MGNSLMLSKAQQILMLSRGKGYTDQQISDLASTVYDIINANSDDIEALQKEPHAPPNAEENVIISIRRNGKILPPQNKAVNIPVPEKVSELQNDTAYVSEAKYHELKEMLRVLCMQTADALPGVAASDRNTLYFIRKASAEPGKRFDTYAYIDGQAEKIGGVDFDINDYALISAIDKADTATISEIYRTGKSPVEKYLGTSNIADFWNLLRPTITNHTAQLEDLAARMKLAEMIIETDVSGNPYYVTFDSFDGINVKGVWNQPSQRIEF